MLTMEEQKKKIRKSIWESFIFSILLIIFSLVLLFTEENIINALILVVGYCGIFLGALHFLMYVRLEKNLKIFSNDLSKALIMIIFGGIAILKRAVLATFLSFLLGAYLIYKNVNRIETCVDLNENNDKYWKFLIGISVVGILLGCLIIFNPFVDIPEKMTLGICLVSCEILNIIQSIAILIGMRSKNEEREEAK